MAISAFCVHGHFYQPPREDPLTGEIPIEEGAYPYSNWNERILAQCYRPNAELLNFSRISFNLGPTVLEWISKTDPDTLNSIVSQENNTYETSHLPNGMAQPYNHTILPLASIRDKQTQIIWGLKEFEFRFGHSSQGIWLPEAAVDSETLRVAYDCGVKYIILAPWQCADQGSDLHQPCWIELGMGKRITAFFYNQALSTRVSFDPGATRNADEFLINTILPELSNGTGNPSDKYVLIASDGELYGHHQRFRDQFLARLTTNSFQGKPIRMITPAAWLQEHPPVQAASIVERSSWSCHHGIQRWCGECDCTPNSGWKEPMRLAFDMIAQTIDDVFDQVIENLGIDPDVLRCEYIHVLLGEVSMDEFIREYVRTKIDRHLLEDIGYLLRSQYERQRMYTSCGWFFDDFDRIEPRNNVKYAAQAIWLTQKVKSDLKIDAITNELRNVYSSRTNLRGDQVFLNHLRSAQAFWATASSRA